MATDKSSLWLPSTEGGTFDHLCHVVARRGRGVWLETEDGAHLLDANAGLWHLSLGYVPHEVVREATQALAELGGTSLLRRSHYWAEGLLADLAPRFTVFDAVLWFATSGSEAIDAAIRIAMAYTRDAARRALAYVPRAYHGVSLGPLALSAESRYRNGSPAVLEAIALPSVSDWRADQDATAAQMGGFFERHGSRIAAVLVECVQAVGGMVVVPDAYLRKVSEFAHQYGCLVIVDEITTGIFRTGPFLAMDATHCVPDMVVLGKGLTAGLTPMSVVAVNRVIADAVRSNPSTNRLPGSTQAGDPFACAAALATLKRLDSDEFADVRARGCEALDNASASLVAMPIVEAWLGRGHLRGVKIEADVLGDRSAFVRQVAALGLRHGLLLHPLSSGVIPIVPALNISPTEVATLLERLKLVLISLGTAR
jgi:adenosylmethionine-8-amino-7-oxononanoate aminotransferase